ncbi:septation protein SepH [Corynebacterium sp. LK2590]|uniref:septation protein SepH n=1 Tax=unclassified Corynebacterium TaxID=2624378 RepID=UPI0034CD2CE7
MRELFLVNSDSTESSLVLRANDGEEFFLAVDDATRSTLASTIRPTDDETSAGDVSADSSQDVSAAAGSEDHEGSATGEVHGPADHAGASAAASTPTRLHAASPSGASGTGRARPATHAESKKALPLRPAEIQHRIRAGATAASLAEELGVDESRLESFAHPVMLERYRVADLAKQAHPVREDGPAKLTLWEVLATAFAARGHTLAEAEWDAYREKGEPWVVCLRWRAGLSDNEAEWLFKQTMTSEPTVEARNSVAADLTDPDFAQPVRSLTSVGRGNRYETAVLGDDWDDEHDAAAVSAANGESLHDASAPEDSGDADRDRSDSSEHSGAEENSPEEFLQNPDPEKKPTKRRRKAVTPHWEDVLLGVRANTKRPKN